MRTFALIALLAKQVWPEYESKPWLNAEDEHGRQHVLHIEEAHLHLREFICACRPKNNRGVIVHRRMRNSRSLYQPWQDGH